MSRLFEGLNGAQLAAVKNTDGPALVIAGAGSGKTRVLTFRIAHLMEKNVAPYKILALTFTNKAAREMQERIHSVLGDNSARDLWMGTFHSIFARILRYESENLGYPSDFTIYDTVDSKSLLKSIIRDLKLDDKIYKVGDVLGRISSAKNKLITPVAYYNDARIRHADEANRRPMLAEVYKRYASRCKKAGAMDFDDLLLNTNILFRDFPDILAKYQQRFDYLLVDEYQDTNFAQYLIVKKLAEGHKNVCVVGDDAQSIYSFRGAMIENILNFKNDYPNYNIYKLEQNYRSTQNIVNAANSVIDKNSGQIKKTIFSEKEDGDLIHIGKALTDIEEGFMVSSSIFDTVHSEHLNYSDFAILYRTNSQSRIFEEALRKRNIPYKVYGGTSFYQRKEIKDVISYLRMLVNPKDDEAFKRVINYPARGIGKTTVGKIEEFATARDISLWEVIGNIASYNNILKLNAGTIRKIGIFQSLINEYQQKLETTDAYQLALDISSASGVMKDLHNGTSPEERSKYENLEELLNGIRDFVDAAIEEDSETSLSHYLENVSLLTDTDKEKDEDRNKVSIMTVHSAKGLEFKEVFVVGCEEELFPSNMVKDDPKGLEEERRLFYVAITRAMEKVTLSYAKSRYKWGNATDCTPSRFLREIEAKYVDWEEDPRLKRNTASEEGFNFQRKGQGENNSSNAFTARPKNIAEQARRLKTKSSFNANFKADPPEKIQQGMVVEHQRFGKGKIVHIDGEKNNRKATVFFQQIKQEKQLLLKFAKLRIVNTM